MTEGTKYDEGKLPYDLLPWQALEEVTKVLQHGAVKYGPYNWTKGISYGRLFAAAFRHLLSFWRGENKDPETGLSHLAHVTCCVLFLLHFSLNEKRYKKYDNRTLKDKQPGERLVADKETKRENSLDTPGESS